MTMFNVYRREVGDIDSPVAIATGLTSKSYRDTTAEAGKQYLYSVGVVVNSVEKVSDEILVVAVKDQFLDFVDFIIDIQDELKDVSRSFKDSSPNGSAITVIDSPVIVKPLYNQPCIVMNQYGSYSTTIPALNTSNFSIELDFANLAGGAENGRVLSITNSGGNGSLLLNMTGGDNAAFNVLINNGSWNALFGTPVIMNNNFKRLGIHRISGVFYLTVNDELIASNSSYLTYAINNTRFNYNSWHASTEWVCGVFSQCRITQHDVRYDASSPWFVMELFAESLGGDNYFDNVLLLAKPTKNGLVDKSIYGRTFTKYGDPSFTGDIKQIGESVSVFGNLAAGLQVGLLTLDFDDFTYETYYHNMGGGQIYERFAQFGTSDNTTGSCALTTTSISITAFLWIDGAYRSLAIASGLTLHKTDHICFMRKGGVFYTFCNGIPVENSLDQSLFDSFSFGDTVFTSGRGLAGNTQGRYSLHGQRFTRAARYPVSGFTPPTDSFL